MARPKKNSERTELLSTIKDASAGILVPLDRITKDVRKASVTMTNRQARYLVDTYYKMQDNRIRAEGQIRAMEQANQGEPHLTLDWFAIQSETMEKAIKSVLGEFARGRVVGEWSQSIIGIGPVISAGLIAHIEMVVWTCQASTEVKKKRMRPKDQCTAANPCSDICGPERVNTASRIWRYAGLDPTVVWGKGEKRPWNASLKVLCWKIRQSFVKQVGKPDNLYGTLYTMRKEREVIKNNNKDFADQAAHILATKKIGKDKDAYKWYEQGMLPPAHIQARSERYAMKIFLTHWHMVAYREKFGEMPPKPYALDILGHKDTIQVPNWPWA